MKTPTTLSFACPAGTHDFCAREWRVDGQDPRLRLPVPQQFAVPSSRRPDGLRSCTPECFSGLYPASDQAGLGSRLRPAHCRLSGEFCCIPTENHCLHGLALPIKLWKVMSTSVVEEVRNDRHDALHDGWDSSRRFALNLGDWISQCRERASWVYTWCRFCSHKEIPVDLDQL